MRTVHLHGRLGKLFGRRFELEVNSAAEAVRALAFQLPGFAAYFSKRCYQISVGPDLVLGAEELQLQLGRGRDIHLTPAGAVAGIETILLVGALVLTAALSVVTLLSMPKVPKPGDREEATKTASFMFDGPQNVTEQGHPVPLVYGRFRVGSVLVSAGIATTDVNQASISADPTNPVFGGGGGGYGGYVGETPGFAGSDEGREWSRISLDKGGKGAGGQARAAQEDPNTLQSQATAKIIDVVSEGEIVGLVDGLKSVYFDETPLQNPDDSFNFAGVAVEQRVGLPDQDFMPGFSQTENTVPVDTKVSVAVGPIVRTITDPDATVARVTIRLPQLYQQDTTNGDMKVTSVEVSISVQADGGGFTEVTQAIFNGKTTSGYQRSYDIRLPPGDERQVKVTRVTPDSAVASLANDTYFDLLTEVVEAKLSYPDTALYGLTVDARQFGSNIPTRSYDIKGLIVEVPTNYDPEARTYAGVWDGTFKRAWTDNAAWVYRDIIVNRRYGLGTRVPANAVDKWTLYAISQYNDELVPDGFGGMHPRYTLNCCLNSAAAAYDVIASIASNFRGWAYWGSGSIMAAQDRPEDPSILVTPSNVVDATIAYGRITPLEKRRSVFIVYWNDPEDGFKLNPEIYEDPELIRRFGRRTGDPVTAFGVTNRGQARRMAMWLREDESQGSNTTATYDVGDDHGFVEPGRIAQVADPMFTASRRGGRVRLAGANQVTLDAPFTFVAGQAYTLRVVLPDGSTSVRPITNGAGAAAVVDLGGVAYVTPPIVGAVWTIESDTVANRLFRLRSITSDDPPYRVSAILHDPTKYPRVEEGLDLTAPSYMDLPTGPLENPSGLNVIEFLLQDGTSTVPSVQVSWKSAQDPRIAFYQAQYKRPGSNWEAFADGIDVSRVVRNSEAGDWDFRVRAFDSLGHKTAWIEKAFTLDGHADLLPEVEVPDLLINAEAFIAKLVWMRPADVRPLRFEVLYNDVNNIVGAASLGVTDEVEWAVALPGFYWVRTVFINAVSPAPEVIPVSADAIGFLGDFGDLATRDTVALGTGGQVRREDGTTPVTDALAVTSLGTAAAIASQGALATASQVNLGSGGRVYREDGSTRLTDALAITSLGTAASIAAQGALATLSQVQIGAAGRVYRDDGTTRLTDALAVTSLGTAAAIASQGALATLSQVQLGSTGRVYRDDGTTRLTDALAVTSLGTAAAIASQGALATLSAVDLATTQVTNKTAANIAETATLKWAGESGADITGGHTASAIASQGALATLSQVNFGATVGRVFREDGTTRVTDAAAVTSLGTAAAISGQGAFATVSSAAYGSSFLTGFGTLAPRNNVRIANELVRADGVTATTDAMLVTSLGTASAIASQGALATASQVNWGSTGRVYRDDGVTRVTDASSITSLGTAAAISGQGAFATVSSAAYGSSLLTGFGTLAPRNNVRIANELVRADGTTATTDAMLVTSLGTASAIAGQGSFATLSSAAYGSSLLTGFGTLAPRNNVRLANEVYRADGSTLLTDALAVTSLGTAAAISGQGALATKSTASLDSDVTDGATYKRYSTVEQTKVSTVGYYATSGRNLVLNSGAESGVADPWSYGYEAVIGGGLSSFSVNAANPNSGKYCFALNKAITADGGQVNHPSFSFKPGDIYAWRIRAKGNNAAASGLFFIVREKDNTGAPGTYIYSAIDTSDTVLVNNVAVTTAYQIWEGTYTVPPGIFFGSFAIANWTGGPTTLYVDDVEFVKQSSYLDLGSSAVRLGVNITRNDGSTALTDALAVTSLGTAAAISGQGALATQGQVYFDGGFIKESFGGADATLSNFKTSSGTAAAIASQGALATLGQVNLGSSGRVYRDDGTTRLTDALAVTSLGTAAAITSQGSYATLSQTYFGDGLLKESSGGATATLANFKTSSGTAAAIASQGTLATRNTARLGTEVYRADGTTVLTDALAVTSLGTAAAIASQGTGATANNLTQLNSTEGAKLTSVASGATNDLKLTSIGTQAVTISGNTFLKTVAVDSHQACVRSEPLDRAIYAEVDIVAGAFYTVITLDDDATTIPTATNLHVSYLASTGGLDVFRNNVSVLSTVITANLTGKLAVAYDSLGYRIWVAGVERIPSSGMTETAGLKLWAKWTAYTSGSPLITGLLVSTWVDNSLATKNGKLPRVTNVPNALSQNLGYKVSVVPSWTAAAGTPATATISIGAFSIYNGSTTVSYSAMSVNVSGTGGATVTYYLYADDANNAGGAQTLVATTTGTDIYQNDARIALGSVDVTFPTSGSGGGGGTGGGGSWCVWAEAWVETQDGFVLARDVQPGDMLRVLTEDRLGTEWEPCTSNELAVERGWRITSASGVDATVSVSTPITLRDGSVTTVPQVQGLDLPVFVEYLRWEPCWAEEAGDVEVCKIKCNQRTYAAGDVAGRSIMTHNPKP